MLALVVLVLSVLAAPAESRVEVPPTGESCPDSGGCCACVSCCKRVANAPVALRPVASENATAHVLPSGRRAGIEEVGAVWHPPRG